MEFHSRVKSQRRLHLSRTFFDGNYQLQKGVVKNEKMRREIIHHFEEWLKRNRFLIIKKRDNELVGKICWAFFKITVKLTKLTSAKTMSTCNGSTSSTGFSICKSIKKRDNELVGKNGNRERFYYLKIAKSH